MEQIIWRGFSFIILLVSGYFLFSLCVPFVTVRRGWWWKALLFLTLEGSSNMVIWVGDPNLLYTLPVFFILFFLCTQGQRVGRLAVCMIFFCLILSVSALTDTYVGELIREDPWNWEVTRLIRLFAFAFLYLLLHRRISKRCFSLSPRLWKLVLVLAVMPLCSMASVVLLTQQKYESQALYSMSMNLGIAVLPVVLMTSAALLFSITVLAEHERLERENHLASLREVYYQGLRQQQNQVRQLRHDLRNHLSVIGGFLEQGDSQKAAGYLKQLGSLEGLRATRRFCENEIVNAVICAKAAEIEQQGIQMDFAVSLPRELPFADTDLCALLGNALDNAREGTAGCEFPKILLRCRMDKGLFMLRVENPAAAKPAEGLRTSKPNPSAHGFGIPGMREIAERYGGTLEAGMNQGKFQLFVCLQANETGR